MIKSTIFNQALQTLLQKEEVNQLVQCLGYHDTARDFKVYDLLLFFGHAAFQRWDSYREGALRAASCGLGNAHFSTISKKAAAVPFQLFKQLLHLLLKKCNRFMRRSLKLPKDLLLIDATQVTVGVGRLPWAHIQGSKAGVKLHVAFTPASGMPAQVEESIGKWHDSKLLSALVDIRYILVADRAYGKHITFDQYATDKQLFVIRIRNNTYLHEPIARRNRHPAKSPVIHDITCQLGRDQKQTQMRHRVVILKDDQGREIWLATNLDRVSAERVAEIYKCRWQIELFFRWVKQQLNVPKLFGTTPNAVYSQLYIAVIIFVLLKWLFETVQPRMVYEPLSFVQFARFLSINELPAGWRIHVELSLNSS